jgi:hypothetical protein
MKVKKADALKVFAAINFKAATGWSDDRMVVKLNKMPTLVDEATIKTVLKKDKATGTLLKQIIEAVENEETVELAGGKEKAGKTPPPAKGKAAKGKKAAAVEDDDDEEEDDEEEDEEDEEEEEDSDDEDDEEDEDDTEDEDSDDEEDEEDDDEESVEDDDESDEEEEEDSDEDEDDSEDDEDDDDEDDSDDDDSDDEEDEEETVATKTKNKKGAAPAKAGKVDKAAAKAGGKNGKPEKGKAPPKKAGGAGVIGSIVEFMAAASEKKPLSKKGLLEKLKKRFPDRPGEAMMTTINIQVPNRLKVNKGILVSKNENGYWIDPKKNAKALKALSGE